MLQDLAGLYGNEGSRSKLIALVSDYVQRYKRRPAAALAVPRGSSWHRGPRLTREILSRVPFGRATTVARQQQSPSTNARAARYD